MFIGIIMKWQKNTNKKNQFQKRKGFMASLKKK